MASTRGSFSAFASSFSRTASLRFFLAARAFLEGTRIFGLLVLRSWTAGVEENCRSERFCGESMEHST